MPDTQDTRSGGGRIFYGYIIVAAAFLIQTAMFSQRASYGVYLKPLIADFGWSRALVSGAYSLSTIVQGVSGIVMGSLNDRFGPRVVITICGLLLGIGGLLMSRVDLAWQLYIYYGLMVGIGMGSYFVTLLSTVARWFVKKRNLMTGLAMAGGGTGGLIGPPIITWLIEEQNWRSSYLISSAVILVLIIIIAQSLKRDPSSVGQQPYGAAEAATEAPAANRRPAADGSGFTLGQTVHTWQFWTTIVVLFCLGYCMITMLVHIVAHVTDLGISLSAAANLLSTTAAAHLTGGIVMGILADRIGLRRVYILCFTLLAAALFWLLAAGELWEFFIFAAVLGLGGGGATVLMSPLVADLFGIKSHGLILGVCAFCCTIGSAVGPYVAGYIFDMNGSYQPAFIICSVMAVIGLLLTLLLRPPLPKNAW